MAQEQVQKEKHVRKPAPAAAPTPVDHMNQVARARRAAARRARSGKCGGR